MTRLQNRRDTKLTHRQDSKVKAGSTRLKRRFQGRQDPKLTHRQDSKVKAGSTRLKGKAKADSKGDKTQSWLADKIPRQDTKTRHKTDSSQLVTPEGSASSYKLKATSFI